MDIQSHKIAFLSLLMALFICSGINAQEISPKESAILQFSNPVSLSDSVIFEAAHHIGCGYELGTCGPNTFDCSNFTKFVFGKFGIELPANALAQTKCGTKVADDAVIMKGDLVFFAAEDNLGKIGHVGIVIDVDYDRGDFSFIHCASSGVIISRSSSKYYLNRYFGAARVIPEGR